MDLLASALALAAIGTGVAAVVVSRGLWRAMSSITLLVNGLMIWSMVAIRLAHAYPGDPRRFDGWERVAAWSALGNLLGMLWAFAIVVVAVGCMVQSRSDPDAVIGPPTRGGWMLEDVLRLVLAHALLALGQGFFTLVWVVPRLPWS
ncbi:MAG: hypothetical protein NCW75_11915 [Phycisphaera sp.]|nr:MAG: hypothetical protein NCW75_11915 [Phycisphaera sp.]